MKKKILSMLLFALAIFLLTGCVQVRTEITIGKDGSIESVQNLGVSKKLVELSGENQMDSLMDDKEEYEKEGFKVEEYENDDFVGMKLSKKFDSIKEFLDSRAVDGFSEDIGNNPFTVEVDEGFFGDIIKIKGDFPFKSSGAMDSDELMAMQLFKLTDTDISFTINTPVKADKHNATDVKGKSYSWELDITKDQTMELEFKTLNIGNIMLIVGAGIVVILLVAFLLFRKKKSKHEDQSHETIIEE
ncbi:LppM family (lipo)protein [Bacillus kwashiorkori]|uniref:LppM family (lipo)protein n=1 Tax=Bacillus kwashiorkori TaxID=1522318 RepID=UPI0007828D3B|nr:DUF3153 domain-containing protein [Bacillus kwashiorkori]